MIVRELVGGLLSVIAAVLRVIPDQPLPSIASDALDDFAVEIGGALGGLDGLLPISEIAVFVGWVLGTWLPAMVTYQVAHWVWGHLPIIGNGE